jgi:hypothetical protein
MYCIVYFGGVLPACPFRLESNMALGRVDLPSTFHFSWRILQGATTKPEEYV